MRPHRRAVYLDLSDAQYEYLLSCARIRRCTISPLLSRVLQVIADDQMVLAVLDDDSRTLRTASGRKAHNRAGVALNSSNPRELGAFVLPEHATPRRVRSRVEAVDRYSTDPSPIDGLTSCDGVVSRSGDSSPTRSVSTGAQDRIVELIDHSQEHR